jgi:NitT/TauT family transport system ATP-binding protein
MTTIAQYGGSSTSPTCWTLHRSERTPRPAFVDVGNVTLTYGTRADRTTAIQGASLSFMEGEFVAIVGPSGCGKSTLMRLIAGLLLPSEGMIKVSGNVVTGPVERVGMAFQDSTLLPWRTTLDNVLLSFELSAQHKRRFRGQRKEYAAKAQRLLDVIGLGEFARKYPWQLSGGMQQRASLCRAIIHDPALLMLDEPFGALDAFTREEMWVLMQDLWLERKFTAALVTHDLREAVFLADRVFVMSSRPGRIVHEEPVALARPRQIDATFGADFGAIVHGLRERVYDGKRQ